MKRTLLPLLFLFGCEGPPVTGTVVDAISGQGMAGQKVVAKATTADASLTCKAFEGETAEDGTFSIAGLCGGVTYAVSLTDQAVWIPSVPTAEGGAGGDVKLEVYRVSKGAGVYKLAADGSSVLSSHGDLKQVKALEGGQEIFYPGNLPPKVHEIKAGEHLVLNGKYAGEAIIAPLRPSGPRKFAEDMYMDRAWAYLGVDFASDTELTEMKAKIDDSKVLKKEADGRKAWFIPFEALEPGRYAVFVKEKRARVTMFDVGEVDFKLPEAEAN